jgi:hypothetical protein
VKTGERGGWLSTQKTIGVGTLWSNWQRRTKVWYEAEEGRM